MMTYRLFAVSVALSVLSGCGQNLLNTFQSNEIGDSPNSTPKIQGCATTATAVANTISGYACYADQLIATTTIEWVAKPIRFAVVQLLDNTNDNIVDEKTTDAAGYFQLSSANVTSANFRVRVLSQGSTSPQVSRVLGSTELVYAVAKTLDTFSASGVSVNIVAGNNVTGQVFNLFDQIVSTHHYLRDRAKIASPDPITLVWFEGNQNGTYYCVPGFDSMPSPFCPAGNRIYVYDDINDADGYDDSVILHELGHYVLTHYSADDSPGQTHYLDDNDQDIRLSWSEGFATAFATSVQRYNGNINADRYLDTDGKGGFLIEYYLEVPRGGQNVFSPKTTAFGIASEVAVSIALWDVLDDPTTETFDDIADENSFWATLKSMSTVSSTSFQDFWELWPGASLKNVMTDRKMYLWADTSETDDALGQAKPLTLGMANEQQHSLHSVNDADWVSMSLTAGSPTTIESRQIYNGVKIELTLYNASGSLVTGLAANPASSFNFTPATSGTYYVKISRKSTSSTYSRYGSYTIRAY